MKYRMEVYHVDKDGLIYYAITERKLFYWAYITAPLTREVAQKVLKELNENHPTPPRSYPPTDAS